MRDLESGSFRRHSLRDCGGRHVADNQMLSVLPVQARTGLDICSFILLWCFVFTVPFENILIVPGLGTISRLVGMALIPVAILAGLARGWLRPLSLAHWCMVAFISWSSVSYFWSVSTRLTEIRVFTEVQALILVLVVWQFATSEAHTLALSKAYVLGTLVSCVGTVYRFHVHKFTYYERFSAEGFDPNDLSLALVLSIPLAYYLFLRSRTSLGYGWLIQIAAVIIACLLTASRTGAVVALLGLSVVPITLGQLTAKRRALVAMILMGAVVACLCFTPAYSWKRLSTITTEVRTGDLNQRTEIWKGGIESFGNRPIVGAGAGAFQAAVEPLVSYFDSHHEFVAHNTYVSVLTELGVLGFLLFLILLSVLVMIVFEMDPLAKKAYLVAFAVWAVGVMTLTWEHRKPTWVLFALIVQSAGDVPKVREYDAARRRLALSAEVEYA